MSSLALLRLAAAVSEALLPTLSTLVIMPAAMSLSSVCAFTFLTLKDAWDSTWGESADDDESHRRPSSVTIAD